VFAAIKLTRSESGANAPHPIKLVFASKEPVYPMKLTAIAGGKPGFELFVIGDERASCDRLQVEFCDRFLEEDHTASEHSEKHLSFSGRTTNCGVGHAGICPLMWDNCVLTKFVGNVDAAGMTKDIQFAWKPFRSYQDHYFTQYGAGCVALMLFVIAVGVWNVLCMKDYARGLIPAGLIRYFVRRLLPGIAGAAIAAGLCFALLPKLGDSDFQVSRGWRSDYRILGVFEDRLPQRPDVLKRTEPEIAGFLLQELRNCVVPVTTNPVVGGELKVEDSPGNFTIEKRANQVVIRVYDRFGTAVVETLPIESAGNPSRPDPASGSDGGLKH
jgi:hypothetical protein